MKARIFLFVLITYIFSLSANATPKYPTHAPLPIKTNESKEVPSNSAHTIERNTVVEPDQKASDSAKYNEVVEEYRQYLASVKPEIRDEIREYRKEVLKINKAKTAVYKKLSQGAQEFLAKERALKKKLPIRDKKAFNKEAVS